MAKRLQIALIGAGHMGAHHARALAERPDVDLVAVCDVVGRRAGEVALACGGVAAAEQVSRGSGEQGERQQPDRPAHLRSPAHLFSCSSDGTSAVVDIGQVAKGLDAAVIAASTSAHRDLAVGLLERGVGVLVEKPLAATAAEARQIARAARASGAVCQAGHILRFDPVTRAADALDVRPGFVDVSWAAPMTARSMDVGVVMDLATHGIDLVLHWVGEMPERVDACGAHIIGPHEDLVNVRLVFPGGCVATLTASRLSRTRERLIRLFAEDAYVKLDYARGKIEVIRPKAAARDLVAGAGGALNMEDLISVENPPVEAGPDALRAQLDAFLAAVRGERPVAVPAEQGVRVVEVAEQVLAAIGAAHTV